MKKRSAMVMAGMIVSALVAGMVSREATLARPTTGALTPSAVVIQQAPPGTVPGAPSSFIEGGPND